MKTGIVTGIVPPVSNINDVIERLEENAAQDRHMGFFSTHCAVKDLRVLMGEQEYASWAGVDPRPWKQNLDVA